MTDIEMIQSSITILNDQIALLPRQRALQDAQFVKQRASQDKMNVDNLARLQDALAKAQAPAS